MERTASIPAWVSRRGWNRRNPAWVRMWLVRRTKGDRPAAPRTETATATILQFPRDPTRA